MKLVSAILPTRGRQEWAKRAVEMFHAQTYPNKELIILDDEDDASFPDGPSSMPGLSYGISKERNIGAKRNHCCRLACGEIIMHWDSDDWYDNGRMWNQVMHLEQSQKQVVGYHTVLFYGEHLPEDRRYLKYYVSPAWAVGVSLTYTRLWWSKHRFNESKPLNSGEDNEMTKEARDAKELCTFDGGKMIVARIHEGNTAQKYLSSGPSYKRVTRADFPDEFFQ